MLPGFRVGVWTDPHHPTGCTVILPPPGALGALAIRGGAPGTREAAALSAIGKVQECHAVVLSGGSAFGLATADGVAAWCEEHGIGYDRMVARIPIVGGAIVFDLHAAGAPRPGPDAGRAACEAAVEADPPMGSVGAGAGCTVGKHAGLQWGSKGGQGWAQLSGGGITVGALMVANPLGDVIAEDGTVLAGSRAPADAPRYPLAPPPGPSVDGQATVIGCVMTDAMLSKADAVRVADLAHTGIARSVEPAHTSFDGDAIFTLSAQRHEASLDLVAHLASQAVAQAIRLAVRHAQGIPGFPADPRALVDN